MNIETVVDLQMRYSSITIHNAYLLVLEPLQMISDKASAKVSMVAKVYFTESYYEKVATIQGKSKHSTA